MSFIITSFGLLAAFLGTVTPSNSSGGGATFIPAEHLEHPTPLERLLGNLSSGPFEVRVLAGPAPNDENSGDLQRRVAMTSRDGLGFECFVPRAENENAAKKGGELSLSTMKAMAGLLDGSCFSLTLSHASFHVCPGVAVTTHRGDLQARHRYVPDSEEIVDNRLRLLAQRYGPVQVAYACGGKDVVLGINSDSDRDEGLHLVLNSSLFCVDSAVDAAAAAYKYEIERMRGTCLQLQTSGWWQYRICLHSDLTQFHGTSPETAEGGNSFLIGKWSGDEGRLIPMQAKYEDLDPATAQWVQSYVDGSMCDVLGNEHRRADVVFQCGVLGNSQTSHVRAAKVGVGAFMLAVTEEATCHYRAVLALQGICNVQATFANVAPKQYIDCYEGLQKQEGQEQ